MKIFSPSFFAVDMGVRVKGSSGDGRELPSCPKGPSLPDWEDAGAFWDFGDGGVLLGELMPEVSLF